MDAIKIIKIEEMKNLTLGYLLNVYKYGLCRLLDRHLKVHKREKFFSSDF